MGESNKTVDLNVTSSYSEILEQPTAILSVSVLSLSVLVGTSGNVFVFIALCRNKLFRKVRYALLLLLTIVSLSMDLIYCPIELARIILFLNSNIAWMELKYVSTSAYLIFFTAISCVLLFISLKNLCIITEKFTQIYRYALCVFCVISTILVILCPALGYGILSDIEETTASPSASFHILNPKSFLFRIIYFSLWILIIVFVLVGMISFIVVTYRAKQSDLDLSSNFLQSHTQNKTIIPKVLVKNSRNLRHSDPKEEEEEEEEGEEEEEEEEAENQFLDAYQGKEDNTSTLGDLPSPSRSKGSHLGVNMAAYLGRRRHTIGQIGTTGIEPLERAKQYNYVRKFSVDIQALQAQLENPKRHASDFPFSSDTEIQKSLQKANDKDDIIKRIKMAQKSPLVKNNCTSESVQDEEKKSQTSCISEKNSNEITPELPPLLTISETTADEFRERAHEKDPSSCFIKLSCSLVLTFLCCVLPMFITDILKSFLSASKYVNLITLTIALSTLQTLVFPLIILILDLNVNKCFQKITFSLHRKCFGLCYQREAVPTSNHEEDHISSTQV